MAGGLESVGFRSRVVRRAFIALHVAFVAYLALLALTFWNDLYRGFVTRVFEALFAVALTYTAFKAYKYYSSGLIGRVYLALLVTVASLMVVDVSNLTLYTLWRVRRPPLLVFTPLYLVVGVSALIAVKYLYDLWVEPVAAKGGMFYRVLALGALIAALGLLAFRDLLARGGLVETAYLAFNEYNLLVTPLIAYLVKYFRTGVYAGSWGMILLMLVLYVIRNYVYCIAAAYGLPAFVADFSETLAIYAYIAGSIGLLAQVLEPPS